MTPYEQAAWKTTQELFDEYNRDLDSAVREFRRASAQTLGVSEEALEQWLVLLRDDWTPKLTKGDR
jgi:hypothetical protein